MTTTPGSARPTHTVFPGQAAAPEGPVDVTNMYLFHFAFRRDVARFGRAVTRTPVDDLATWKRLDERWAVFAQQLLHHHEAEDRVLWPWLRERATVDELEMLDAMEQEHAAIDPALAQITEAFATLGGPGGDRADVAAALAVRLTGAREVLERHLAHEEADAMAVLQRVATQADWDRLEGQFSKGSPISAVIAMVPWALDGVDAPVLRKLLHKAPLPLRVIHRFTRSSFRRREAATFAYA